MKLSDAQINWLQRAAAKGYETGFVVSPARPLIALERLGLVERHPQTRGKDTHWRITAKGQDLHRLMS